MNTEELDALDAMIREAHFEVIEDYEGTHLATIPASVETLDALINAAPRLLAEAREAATLRAKFIESETRRTELRQEMDAVKGKLREVTGLLSDMVERAGPACSARDMLGDPHCDDEDCDNCDFDDRVIAALETAR